MNHMRNAIRLAIIIFWMLVVGLSITAISNYTNATALLRRSHNCDYVFWNLRN